MSTAQSEALIFCTPKGQARSAHFFVCEVNCGLSFLPRQGFSCQSGQVLIPIHEFEVEHHAVHFPLSIRADKMVIVGACHDPHIVTFFIVQIMPGSTIVKTICFYTITGRFKVTEGVLCLFESRQQSLP